MRETYARPDQFFPKNLTYPYVGGVFCSFLCSDRR
jgi:hypothetical protein